MPIIRTYGCPECSHVMDVVLDSSQWDEPPPECPRCNAYDLQEPMQQQFKPVAIGGSNRARAVSIAQDIAANDYKVADIQTYSDGVPKVRYKDESPRQKPAAWGAASVNANATLETAIAIGRETRLKYGNGLDVLHSALASGAQPDLIANSKKQSIKIW
jgi:hypothetical protein